MTTSLALALAIALAAPGAALRNGRTRVRPPAADTAPASPAAAAPELSDAEVTARVEAYLDAIDTPVSAEAWGALGSRAVAPLQAVATSGTFPSRRAKAVAALSIIGGERARDTVLSLAKSDAEPFAVRASALRSAARVLTSRELSSALTPVLEGAPQRPVRAVAAQVLARHAPQAACTAIRSQAAREGDRRAAFAGALERCAGAP